MKRLVTIAAAIAAIAFAPGTAGAQSATPAISLIHGIPGVTVDLMVDGTVVLDAFAPGSIVDITSFAGRTLTDVQVVSDADGAVIIGPIATLEVPDTGNWSLIAHLNGGGDATLSSFENNLADPGSGETRLTLRHVAAAPALDLVLGDQRPITNAANGGSAEIELPNGELTDASIALSGGNPIMDITGVTLAANTNTILYVVGSADDDTLEFVVQIVELPTAATTTTSTTVAGSTTTTSPTPSAVNTGSPISGSSSATLLVVAMGGLALAGGSYLVRRRV